MEIFFAGIPGALVVQFYIKLPLYSNTSSLPPSLIRDNRLGFNFACALKFSVGLLPLYTIGFYGTLYLTGRAYLPNNVLSSNRKALLLFGKELWEFKNMEPA